MKCDVCECVIDEENENWGIINDLNLCEIHNTQISAVYKINSAFACIVCEKIKEVKQGRAYCEHARKNNDSSNNYSSIDGIGVFMGNTEDVEKANQVACKKYPETCNQPCVILQRKKVDNPYICCLNCNESLLCLSKKRQGLQYITPCTLLDLQRCEIAKAMKELDATMLIF